MKKIKVIIFLVSILALTIVVFNNIVQLQNTFALKSYDVYLLLSFILTLAGVGIYTLYNITNR